MGRITTFAFLLSFTLSAQTDDLAAKFEAMEARIKALEAEVSALKAALPAPPAPAEAPAPAPSTASVSDATGRLMNPAISAIGNFLGAAGHNANESRRSLEMAETEVALSAAVDPYARADVFLSFGEEGVEVEEAYMTFTSLPAGLLLKAGRMRAQFGKVNTWHRHTVPWVDRPLVTNYLLGGEEGIRDAGFSISRLLPSAGGVYLDATAELYRGDSGELFQQRSRNDLTAVGHLRGYRDITESTNVDLGFSFARGHYTIPQLCIVSCDFIPNPVNRIYGMDATLRWKPLRRSIYHSFVGRTELVWNHRQEPLGLRKAFGYYASADYQLARRWFAGVRIDQSDHPYYEPNIRDRAQSAILTYWPSEFSQIRAQYRRSRYLDSITANELLFQIQFSIGAHGAHAF